jgi:hypothetical protein
MTRHSLHHPSILLLLACCAVFSGCSGGAGVPKLSAIVNENASLSATASSALPANPLKWQIITAAIDPATSTMSTLYGNDAAVRYARQNAKHDYPADSQIALVTWTQRDDPRYFGAKIPDRLKSIEFVIVNATPGGALEYTYQKFEGTPLTKSQSVEGATPPTQAISLLNQRAAVLP